MKPRKLSDAQEQALALEYLAGATISSLAERFRCSNGTVQNALRRCRASKRSRGEASALRKKLTSEQEQVLVEGYLEGSSLEALGTKFTCSPVTVRNTLIRHGIPRRHHGRPARPASLTKTCSSCCRDLPRADFYNEGQRSSECCECLSLKSTDRYESDPIYRQQKIDSAKRWQEKHPDKARARKREWASGWASRQFEAAWEEQQGKCAICHEPMLKEGRHSNSVHADHDHDTLRQRGLLCAGCNRGLGCFRDSPDFLRRAVGYLEEHHNRTIEIGT